MIPIIGAKAAAARIEAEETDDPAARKAMEQVAAEHDQLTDRVEEYSIAKGRLSNERRRTLGTDLRGLRAGRGARAINRYANRQRWRFHKKRELYFTSAAANSGRKSSDRHVAATIPPPRIKPDYDLSL